ncbi:MAG: (d)CMP kinase [Anaerolineae bacterium]
MSRPSTIAIDGPAASGKSTIGDLLARRLGYLFLDTGAMYRALTLEVLRVGVDPEDQDAVAALARQISIEVLPPAPEHQDGRSYTVLVDGRDVTWDIRSPQVDAAVSPVSRHPKVREVLTEAQRRIGERGRVVMTGRDIGTVVLPHADLKVFLDASVEERARRRYLERLARGERTTYEAELRILANRDKIDSERETAPLRQAPDAVYVDTEGLTIEEVLARVLELVEQCDP